MKKKHCKKCNRTLKTKRSKTGLCRQCYRKYMAASQLLHSSELGKWARSFGKPREIHEPHFCLDCGREVKKQGSEYCKKCVCRHRKNPWDALGYKERMHKARTGLKRSEEGRKNIASGVKQAWAENKEFREGATAAWRDPKKRAEGVKRMQELSRSPKERKRRSEWMIVAMKSGRFSRKPNKSELRVLALLKQIGHGAGYFRYVGDGKFWIGNCNPDFVYKAKRLLIEFFGGYWHRDKEKDKKRLEFLRRQGWRVLVLIDKDLAKRNYGQTREKVLAFINNR